jgi:hypothetical protein
MPSLTRRGRARHEVLAVHAQGLQVIKEIGCTDKASWMPKFVAELMATLGPLSAEQVMNRARNTVHVVMGAVDNFQDATQVLEASGYKPEQPHTVSRHRKAKDRYTALYTQLVSAKSLLSSLQFQLSLVQTRCESVPAELLKLKNRTSGMGVEWAHSDEEAELILRHLDAIRVLIAGAEVLIDDRELLLAAQILDAATTRLAVVEPIALPPDAS